MLKKSTRSRPYYCQNAERTTKRRTRKGRFTLYVTFPFRHSSLSIPSFFPLHSVRLICVILSVVFSHLPALHVIGSPRLFPSNMQPHSLSQRQLATIALMLGKEEKNAALNDKKKRMWVHKCFRNRKSESEYWTLYKELADDEMKFYQYFIMSKHQFNYLLQKI